MRQSVASPQTSFSFHDPFICIKKNMYLFDAGAPSIAFLALPCLHDKIIAQTAW